MLGHTNPFRFIRRSLRLRLRSSWVFRDAQSSNKAAHFRRKTAYGPHRTIGFPARNLHLSHGFASFEEGGQGEAKRSTHGRSTVEPRGRAILRMAFAGPGILAGLANDQHVHRHAHSRCRTILFRRQCFAMDTRSYRDGIPSRNARSSVACPVSHPA